MGKLLIQQRRGKGSPRYRAPSHKFHGKSKYPDRENKKGKIDDIIHAPGRKAPLMVTSFDKKEIKLVAGEGFEIGKDVNVKELKEIPEGTKIFNIEIRPGDGGRLCRTSGTFATIISKDEKRAVVLLPSKKKKTVPAKCRAIIGSVAGTGRTDLPFMKAGKKHHAARAAGKLYPRTSGVAMNSVDHPFGGTAKPGKHKSVSRHMPPGKKVGNIAPRRTGRKK
ncbi:50S ribosomal protein L2 [Candidatus Aenigmatarchaeota archaeon]